MRQGFSYCLVRATQTPVETGSAWRTTRETISQGGAVDLAQSAYGLISQPQPLPGPENVTSLSEKDNQFQTCVIVGTLQSHCYRRVTWHL